MIARVIRERGLTPYQVGAISGVDHSAITRFLRGERDLMLSTADKLAAALGLDLVERPRRTRSVPKMGSAEDRGGVPVPKMGSADEPGRAVEPDVIEDTPPDRPDWYGLADGRIRPTAEDIERPEGETW